MAQFGYRQTTPDAGPGPGGRRPRVQTRLAVMAGIVVAALVLVALATGGDWSLAVMAAVIAAIVLVAGFVARGGLAGAGAETRPQAPPVIPLPPRPETSAPQDGSGAPGPASDLADRYYFKGAWFTVTVHEPDSAGHRIDVAGPLCPACHEPMLRAHEREPLEKVGEHRVEVYKCHKSNLHPLVTVQLLGEDRLVDQARSACLHEMADGRFDSLPAEGAGEPKPEAPRPDGTKPEPPKPGGPKPEGPKPGAPKPPA